MKYNLFIIVIMMLMGGCDGGLEPPKESELSYIRGRVHYLNGKDNWPPDSTVKGMRVVAFKVYPPKDIITEITSGNAIYTNQSLPFFVDSSDFEIQISNPPIEYKYIVVAQNYGTMLEWRAVGVYTLTGNDSLPSPLVIEKGKSYFININVDFTKLPPQPF